MSESRWEEDFAQRLIALADPDSRNRAALAHLRRGLEVPLDYTLARVGWLFRRVPEFALEPAVLAAGLFARTKGACQQKAFVNFGQAFGAGLTLDEKHQREKRLIDLLSTEAEELPYKLRQAITLIARNGVSLDWAQLIRHLRSWNHPERWVQKKWARGFWSSAEAGAVPDNE